MSEKEALLAELEADEDSTFASGRLNNLIDITLTILSIFASLAATILISTGMRTAVTASIAAVPAALTSLQRIVGIRRRSQWYFQHSANLKALAVRLRYAPHPDLEDFAKRRAELEVEGGKRWSQL